MCNKIAHQDLIIRLRILEQILLKSVDQIIILYNIEGIIEEYKINFIRLRISSRIVV